MHTCLTNNNKTECTKKDFHNHHKNVCCPDEYSHLHTSAADTVANEKADDPEHQVVQTLAEVPSEQNAVPVSTSNVDETENSTGNASAAADDKDYDDSAPEDDDSNRASTTADASESKPATSKEDSPPGVQETAPKEEVAAGAT